MHGDFDATALKLAFMKEAQARSEVGEDCRSLVQRRREIKGGPGFVVVFEKPRQLVLISQISPEVAAYCRGGLAQETVIQLFIIAIVKTLLHELPLQIPIDLSHKDKLGVFGFYLACGLRPKGSSTAAEPSAGREQVPPGALEDFRENKHGHVTAHAVGDLGQLEGTPGSSPP